jgi:hypothetical protein
MFKKIFSAALLIGALQLGASAQGGPGYTNALGIRTEFGSGGATFGFSGKHFFSAHDAGEAQLLFGSGVTDLGLEYQYHAPIGGAEGLQWYLGFGTAVRFASSTTWFYVRPIGGLDYKLGTAPINLSFDWRPTILLSNAYGGSRFTAGRFGLAARYAF